MHSDIKSEECFYPHSRDVIERETSDEGFSKGWGSHFPPVEDYWYDIHTHVYEKAEDLPTAVHSHLEAVKSRNVLRLCVIPFATVVKGEKSERKDIFSYFMSKNDLLHYLKVLTSVEHTSAILYMHYSNPDIDLIEKAVELGVRGIKLHNACIIMDGSDYKVWLSEEWDKAFKVIGKRKLPVIWHVTQRLGASSYTKSGKNSYWKYGWEKGIDYKNEDLLQTYLKVVERHPDVDFISAHQLHIGWDRLMGLFDCYSNLYTDTTVGCFLHRDDELYETDRNYLRDLFISYSDRILFATDTYARKELDMNDIDFYYSGHIRFIKQLRLPDGILQKIAYVNSEKLFDK